MTQATGNSPIRHLGVFLATLVVASFVLGGCANGPDQTPTPAQSLANPGAPVIKIGSKNFAEQYIIGEMYALLLENAGFNTERKFDLGDTTLAHAALLSGSIDLYPEYTGTGLVGVLKQPVISDPQAVFQSVSQGYKQNFNLVWLQPSPMNNMQAIAITRQSSEKYSVTTLSQFVAQASNLVLVGPPEFKTRDDGMIGLTRVYGAFTLKEYRETELDKRYSALADGQADATVAFSTDGGIAQFGLIVLQDDKGLFPPYNVAPVVRQQTLDANPKLAAALNVLASKLTDTAMQQLNYEVMGQQKPYAEVARAFLKHEGLIR